MPATSFKLFSLKIRDRFWRGPKPERELVLPRGVLRRRALEKSSNCSVSPRIASNIWRSRRFPTADYVRYVGFVMVELGEGSLGVVVGFGEF